MACHWKTWEQPVSIGKLASNFKCDDIVLLDCLTTWLNNELFFVEDKWQDEAFQAALFEQMCQGIHAISGQVNTLIIVSNEVLNEPIGDNVFVIHYSPLLGKLHQSIVEECSSSIFSRSRDSYFNERRSAMKGVMIQGTASDVGKSLNCNCTLSTIC